jgi:hypothetical protein
VQTAMGGTTPITRTSAISLLMGHSLVNGTVLRTVSSPERGCSLGGTVTESTTSTKEAGTLATHEQP